MLLFISLLALLHDCFSIVDWTCNGFPTTEIMFSGKLSILTALLPAAAFAASSASNASIAGNGSAVLSNGKYEISSEGIRAHFVPYGASISNLFVRDVHGIERDIVLGWDNATYYTEDKLHPHFGYVEQFRLT